MNTQNAYLAVMAAFALLFATDMAGQGVAPVNPKFLEWQKRRMVEPSIATNAHSRTSSKGRAVLRTDGGEDEQGFGLVPTVMDMDYLADINAGVVRAPVGGFPSAYDLRTQGRVTPVRNQNPYGTCWAFAAMGSLESWVVGNEGVAVDFSENNLANLHGWDWGFNDGGNATMATAYFVRWGGPVAESSDPYPAEGVSPSLAPVRHVQKVVWIPGKSDSLDNDAIKEAVMERGALYVSYYHASSYYKSATTSYFYPGSHSSNHAVAIVGWDDDYPASNFATRPSGNGAYLVRNSWGAFWGNSGYYWVSYYDGVFARSTMYSFCNAEDSDNYGKIYQYDPLGPINSFSTRWGANIFTATGADRIAAVGFYALAPKTSYSIAVYTSCQSGKPTSGTCALTQTGTTSEPGYVTIPLAQAVSVASGSRFSIVLNLTTPGYSYPHAIEYANTGVTSSAGAAPGQSFYSSNGQSWTDLTQWNGTANFCIKAYAATTVVTPDLASVFVSGPVTVESGQMAAFACTATYTDGSEKTVSANWSLVAGSSYASISSGGTLTAAETAVDRTVVIRASYAEDGIAKTADWQLTVTAGPPSAPTGLSATQGTEPRAVRLNWAAVSGADAYAVYRSATASSANAAYLGVAEATKYSDTSAVPGKDYRYFVKARNSSGTGPFSEGAFGWRALSAPADVAASDGASLDGVAVSWSASEGAARYRVSRADSIEGDFAPVSGWIDATEFFDDTAVAGVKYWYSVIAATDASGSRPSERGVPDDGFSAIPILPESLAVEGAASIASGATSAYSAFAVYSNGSRGVSPVSPTWHVSKGSVARNGTVTAPVVSTNEEVMLTASTTLEGIAVSGSKVILVTTVAPSAPTGVVATASSLSQGVSVAWNPVAGASGYKVYRATGVPPVQSCVGTVTSNSFADTSATPGVAYTYRVSAVNGAGESDLSDSATATIPLVAPAGVAATKDREDCVRVTWGAVAGATHYRLARAASADGEKTLLGAWAALLAFDDIPPSAGTAYFYFVQAATDNAGANAGPWSEPAEGWMKAPRTLVSLSIFGPDRVPSSGGAVYSCSANYSDGTDEPVRPAWSASGAAAIDNNGSLTALSVSTNSSVTVAAYFRGKRATKTVAVLAPAAATATVTAISAAQRWPFSGLVDIDYTLDTAPAGTRATISVSATDRDHGRALAAISLSGDGAEGPVTAGPHRLTWNLAVDHPGFHAASMDVSLEAVPYAILPPTGLTASQGTSTRGVNLAWNAVANATGYEIWRAKGSMSPADAARAATVTDATAHEDTEVAPGDIYFYWLKTVTPYGTSDFSSSAFGYRARVSVTVTFDGNGGTPSASSMSGVAGNAYGTLPTATREGHDFAGWFTAASGGTQVTAASLFDESVTTLYAHWAAKTYAVTLDRQNGTGGTASVTATYGAAMPAITVPTRTGYTFGGYWTAADGSGTQYYTASGASARAWNKTSATTLYAKWTAKTYTVTLNSQSGTGGTASVTATYGAAMPAITVPTKSGYTFGGYWTAADGTGTMYYDGFGASARTWDKTVATTLYAKWISGENLPTGGNLHVDAATGSDANDGRSWATAKASIQNAINASSADDLILVNDGRYEPISTGNKRIEIRSVNGATNTIIDASLQWSRGVTNRCATLGLSSSHTNTFISGFCLTNGIASYGGGSYYGTLNNCTLSGNTAKSSGGGSYHGTLNNCRVSGNSASNGGGSYYGTLNNCTLSGNTASYGGGSYYGTLSNCTLSGNTANNGGGGSYYGTLNDCFLTGNTTTNVLSFGGGSCCGTLNRCTLSGNSSSHSGGGSYDGTLNNCILYGNTAALGGGSCYGVLNNCVLNGNSASSGGGGSYRALHNNCTLVNNTALWGGGCREGTLNNCIVWANTSRYTYNTYLSQGVHTCSEDDLPGVGNIHADPLFVDAANGNFQLRGGSPCIDAGWRPWADNIGVDFAGNLRWQGTQVDMGAYESAGADYSPPARNAMVFYVDASNGNDANDGKTWSSAKSSIQAAIEVSQNGDVILVAPGTYSPLATMDLLIRIFSRDGAGTTIIDGCDTTRCASLGTTTNSFVKGLTLRNGYAQSGGGSYYGTLDSCTLISNVSIYGGGSYEGRLESCVFRDNKATYGGGAHYGMLNNCLLAENHADVCGGATYGATLNNCALSGNTASSSGGGSNGGTLNNCIVWGNMAQTSKAVSGSTCRYSCLDEAVSGEGNIVADPLFVDAENGDYRLRSGSPCIDAGSNAYVVGDTDLVGNPRIANGTVDMGAYEGGFTAYAVNFNGNGGTPSKASMFGVAGEAYGTLPTATRSGYRFAGWSTRADGGILVNADSIVPNSATTLYANWKSVAEPIWTIVNGVLTAVDLNGATDIEIPSTVTAIGTNVFFGCSSLESVVVPSSVKDIRSHAFERCSGLWKIVFSEGMQTLGFYALGYCSSLKRLDIPASVYGIDDFSTVSCHALEWIEVSLGNAAYMSDVGILFNKSKTRIERFPEAYAVTDYAVPVGVTLIGDGAFSQCTRLTSVTIPSGVTYIGGWAFSGCSSLAHLDMPSSVTTISTAALRSTALKRFAWPSSVKVIANDMFVGCQQLEEISIPYGVTSIGSWAFQGCKNLTKVVIPSTVSQIGSWSTFEGCQSLRNVTIMGDLDNYSGFSNFYANTPSDLVTYVTSKWTGPTGTWNDRAVRTMSEPIWTIENGVLTAVDLNGATDIEIPSTVKSIGDYALRSKGMTSLIIPDSVTNIGYFAVAYCNKLSSVAIPPTCTNVGRYAFHACQGLVSVSIPEGVSNLREYAFYSCRELDSVCIPSSVTNLEHGVFADCSKLKAISVDDHNTKYCSINGMLMSKDKTTLVTCPASYASAEIPYGVTCLDFHAFSGCTNLTSIAIPPTVRIMKQSVFRNCTGLTSITIPSSVTEIWANVFYGCRGLTSVEIPASVRSLDSSAFSSCDNLVSINVNPSNPSYCSVDGIVFSKDMTRLNICPAGKYSATIPDGIQVIAASAFDGCKKLRSIIIPSTVKTIGSYAFSSCSGLTSVTIRNGVERIYNDAFRSCSGIAEMVIPESVKDIGDCAFEYCSTLRSLTIQGALDSYTGSGTYLNAPVDNVLAGTPADLVVYVTSNWTGPTDKWFNRTVQQR